MTLDIDVSRLKNEMDTIGQNYFNYTNSLSNGFDRLKQINNYWNDKNTSAFVGRINKDKEKIEDYNLHTKKTIDSICNFINTLSSISSSCGYNDASYIRFNSDNATRVGNYCISASVRLKNTKNIIDYWNIPSSCDYRYQINKIAQDLETVSNEISLFINEYNDISNKIINSVNELKNGPASTIVEPLNLKELSYHWSVSTPVIDSYDDTVNEALNKQDLSSTKNDVNAETVESTFINSSIKQNSSNKEQDIETVESSYSNNSINQSSSINKQNMETVGTKYVNESSNQNSKINEHDAKTVETKYMNTSINQQANYSEFSEEESHEFTNNINSINANINNNIDEKTSSDINIKNETLETNSVKSDFISDNSKANINSSTQNAKDAAININNATNVNINTEKINADINTANFNKSSSDININAKAMDTNNNVGDFAKTTSDISINSESMNTSVSDTNMHNNNSNVNISAKAMTANDILNNDL